MKLLKTTLIVVGIAPLLCLLLAIPMIGVLHASVGAIGGFMLLALLIALQWPTFRLFRRYLPSRDLE